MIHPRPILASAIILTVIAATAGAAWQGAAFGWGVIAGGMLSAFDFAMLWRRTNLQVGLALEGVLRSPAAWFLTAFRLAVVLTAGWYALGHFPPLAVAVGFGSVVSAITMQATFVYLSQAFTPMTES